MKYRWKIGMIVTAAASMAALGVSGSPGSNRTVGQVVAAFGPAAVKRLQPHFAAAGIAYPPRELVFLAMKQEMKLEVWARGDASFRHVKTYRIRKASGRKGPKLREGDWQVPEGIYRISGFNPNSSYHLSMKLNYPNAFDLTHARREGRTQPGTNIFIHGKAASVGCLAMGDPAIEELFVLVAETGRRKTRVVIAPHDPRHRPLTAAERHLPDWTPELYRRISAAFRPFQRARSRLRAGYR
ncbi:MAG: L,D-transpeptidase family protein [Alphaproteobacteria bacterium]|nr:L,D-transpeptidase family protein [Alphaproteobacteria bacterium]